MAPCPPQAYDLGRDLANSYGEWQTFRLDQRVPRRAPKMGLEGVEVRLRQEITTDTGKAGAKALPQTCLRSVVLKSKTVGNISRRDN